ncbi:hypothetical protein [Enhygromyxa salina]|uniref:Uncharacterized protein n=1 Tax=Enhygromyxa salina TaxID=215803 RepID=A0A2S9YSU4_9BACT|nr:hypothetical protein [Enhygromyxa salina]PRQ08181.1 hypothetical protein ENSA7_21530 [Enhygromyxa salina]
MTDSNPTPSFVDAIVRDPHHPPRLSTLVGYPGQAAAPGQRRIYLDIDLSEHVDYRVEDVVHERPVDGELGLPARVIWLEEGALITHSSDHGALSQRLPIGSFHDAALVAEVEPDPGVWLDLDPRLQALALTAAAEMHTAAAVGLGFAQAPPPMSTPEAQARPPGGIGTRTCGATFFTCATSKARGCTTNCATRTGTCLVTESLACKPLPPSQRCVTQTQLCKLPTGNCRYTMTLLCR